MIFEIILLILSIPSGFLIAWLCKDELIKGRFWFLVIFYFGIIVGSIFFHAENYVVMNSCFFISSISIVSYCKSYDRKWTKMKF